MHYTKIEAMKNSTLLLFFFLLVTCRKEDIQNDSVEFKISGFNEHNFKDTVFSEIDSLIRDGKYGYINSIIIIHNNELIKEKYYDGWERNDLHEMQSATKSIASLLVGHAVNNGLLTSACQKTPIF